MSLFNKEELQKLLDLNETIVTERFAGKIKPYAKLIYIVGSVILALAALACVAMFITGSFSAAIISLVIVFIQFVILRMFCEFLMTCQK